MPRRLVVDGDLSKRIPVELRRRGRTAVDIAQLGFKDLKDPALLAQIHELDQDAVLITGDNDMPASHAEALARFGTTLAIVAP